MKHLPSPISYRSDVNGLRAWAVIAVVFFHFQIAGFSAGFFGVDIFFVISGFLMTAIIYKGLTQNSFKFLQFYLSRVRRIFPALAVLITVLLTLGWFWLPTPEYQQLGTQSAYSLSFLSNIHFWRATGYFDSAATSKWLLHTWTLGVEFQFYLIYPIALWLAWKIKASTRFMFWTLVAGFIAALSLSIVAAGWKPNAAFYLLPTRSWEFLAGGLAFLAVREFPALARFSKQYFWAGIGLLATGFVLLDNSFAWPGAWALFPVLGTALIIVADRENTNNQAWLTNNQVAQWLGNRSYSLYLWHWPLVVALYFLGIEQDLIWIAAGIVLSLLLADLSFRWVETPTRIRLVKLSLLKQIAGFAMVGAIIGLSAVSVRLFEFEQRLPAEIEMIAGESKNKDPRAGECAPKDDVSPACVYGTEPVGVILVGDSHAMSTITSLQQAADKYQKSAMFLGKSACPAIAGLKREQGTCFEYNNWLLQQKIPNLNSNTPLIHASRTTYYSHGANESAQPKVNGFFDELAELYGRGFEEYLLQFEQAYIETACKIQQNRQVYLMRPIPEMGIHVPDTLARNYMIKRDKTDIKISLADYHQRHQFVWAAQDKAAEQCGVKILDPLPYLCDDTYCYGSKNGRPLYYDDDHLSEYGNRFLIPMFEQVFAQ